MDLPPTDDPALGEGFTYHVMVSMHHTNWQVLGLTLPSDLVSVDVLDPPAGVVKEYPTRAEWDALTGAAVAEMEAALSGAETARDTTVSARDVTVAARDETLTARDETLTARTETLTARDQVADAAGETEAARAETLTARNATLTARDMTVEARDETLTARAETITAAGVAETARDTAVGAAGEAETARQSAWEAVDTPGRQGPPGEVTTAALTTALAGKVTGTGMTLRLDTTIGTRVLLDHPNGTTMLMGDTGWRDITSICEGIESGTVLIRRTTTDVHWRFQAVTLSPGAGTLTIAITIPFGWRPIDTAVTSTVARQFSFVHRQNLAIQAGNLFWLSETTIMSPGATTTTRPSSTISGILSAPATGWPTAQIGTP